MKINYLTLIKKEKKEILYMKKYKIFGNRKAHRKYCFQELQAYFYFKDILVLSIF